MERENLVGKRFGRLLVVREEPHGLRERRWYCKCDCGCTTIKSTHILKSGGAKSCGCLHLESLARDITNERFGRLVAIRPVGRHFRGSTMWECKCDCGKTVQLPASSLTSGNTRSCGCLLIDTARKKCIDRNTKYFDEESYILSRKILGMKARCYNPNSDGYANYGGRGIKVCDEWKNDTMKFIEWAKTHGFKLGLSIDRIDVNGDYCPENCRFVDAFVQCNNRRNNRVLTIRGKSKTLAQWVHAFDIPEKHLKWLYSEPDHVILRRLIDRLEEIIAKFHLEKIRDIDEIIRLYNERKQELPKATE